MTYDNTNRGTLGKNKNKTEDTHPDYAGKINVDGVDYWLNAWLKTNKETGEKFFSLSVKPKEARGERPSKQAKVVEPEFDDELPF